MSNNTETVMPDHSLSSLFKLESNGRSDIHIKELVGLLSLVFNRYDYVKGLYKLKLKERQVYLDFEHSLDTKFFKKLKAIKDISISTDKSPNLKNWVYGIDKLFNNHYGKKSSFESTKGITVKVYSSSDKSRLNSIFTFFVNKNDNGYVLNASCSPVQLIVGDNTIPATSISEADTKAAYFTDMFMLPFYILGKLLNKHIHIKGGESELSKDVEGKKIKLQKIQIAAYSRPFADQSMRNMALFSLYHVYNGSLINKQDKFSTDIAGALGYVLETSKTSKEYTENGNLKSLSGLMLRFSQGNNPTFSMGLYSKDVVESGKDSAEDIEYQYDEGSARLFIDKKKLKERCIRLDLSIYKTGLLTMSKTLSKEYKGKISPISADKEFDAGVVYKFLLEVFHQDITLGILFKYMFENQMCLGQMLAVTKKQWNSAFDILKEKGLYEVVEQLQSRVYLKSKPEEKNSLTSIIKTHSKVNVTKLRNEIREKTEEYRIKEINGKREKILIRPGVDIQFPYRVNQLARFRFREIYSDLDYLDNLLEENTRRNTDTLEETAKEARYKALKLFNTLTSGKLRNMRASDHSFYGE